MVVAWVLWNVSEGILSTATASVGRRTEGEGRLPAAVLWDMDGTLVDTEPLWIDVEYELVNAHGGSWSNEQAMQLVGNELIESGRYIAKHGPVDMPPEDIVDYLLDGVIARLHTGIPWRSGARDLLLEVAGEDVTCALVTMSYRRLVEPIVAELPAGTFAAVVTGDEVTKGKPHPEPYTAALRRLGLEPQQALAIEDSPTGATSALAAGVPTLVVPHHVAVPPMTGSVHIGSLAEVDGITGLRELHAQLLADRY